MLYLDMAAGSRGRLLERLRRLARERGLVIADEAAGEAARVHDAEELRRAQLAGIPLLFLSPMAHTRSHPEWRPMPRMRAASLVRLSKVPVIALGGMDDEKFGPLERLGFHGWAGIDAFKI